MGKITYDKSEFTYDEAKHKSIGELLCEQKLLSDTSCSNADEFKNCKVYVLCGNAINDGLVRSLSNEEILACEYVPLGDIELKSVEAEVITESDSSFGEDDIGIAITLGGASVIFYFYKLKENSIITIQTSDCPVRETALIRQLLTNTIKATALAYFLNPTEIKRIVISENAGVRAVMPVITDGSPVTYFFPPLAERVDGNITASVYYCNLDKTPLTKLFIDLGAHGEICLSYKGRLYCTTVDNAAIFGGVGISCGMGGQTGGIFGAHVYSNGDMQFSTVNDTVPIGICGTGMIDMVVILRKLGEIDNNGKLLNGNKYILEEESDENPQIYLTQQDIDLIIEAKAKLRVGIDLLLGAVGVSVSDVDELIFGGDVGMQMNFTSAGALGIIPTELVRSSKWGGNTGGLGGGKFLCHFGDRARVDAFSKACEYVDVLSSAGFMEAVDIQKSFSGF